MRVACRAVNRISAPFVTATIGRAHRAGANAILFFAFAETKNNFSPAAGRFASRRLAGEIPLGRAAAGR